MREMKERQTLHHLHTDHVVTRSELKYLIGAKMVSLKCRDFGGKTAPFPTVRVFRVVRPVVMVRVRLEPDPEPTRQCGPVANTTHMIMPTLPSRTANMIVMWICAWRMMWTHCTALI